MPRLDGIEATRRICSQDPCPAVIVLTTFDADEYVYAALRAGASGFMLKDSAPEQLVATLRLAALGDALVTPLRTRALIERHARPGAAWDRNADTARDRSSCSDSPWPKQRRDGRPPSSQ